MLNTCILCTTRSFKLNAIKILRVTFNHPYEISKKFLITSKWLFSPGQLFGVHYLHIILGQDEWSYKRICSCYEVGNIIII